MARRVQAAFLLLAAGCFDVRLGPADGVEVIRYEEVIDRGELAGGAVEMGRELVFVTAERSSEYLDRFGPDKIGAIRGVELKLVEARATGGAFAAPPTVIVAGEILEHPGDKAMLADVYVDGLRGGILSRQEVRLPITVALVAAEGAPALETWAESVEVIVVLQPTFHVDATRSF